MKTTHDAHSGTTMLLKTVAFLTALLQFLTYPSAYFFTNSSGKLPFGNSFPKDLHGSPHPSNRSFGTSPHHRQILTTHSLPARPVVPPRTKPRQQFPKYHPPRPIQLRTEPAKQPIHPAMPNNNGASRLACHASASTRRFGTTSPSRHAATSLAVNARPGMSMHAEEEPTTPVGGGGGWRRGGRRGISLRSSRDWAALEPLLACGTVLEPW